MLVKIVFLMKRGIGTVRFRCLCALCGAGREVWHPGEAQERDQWLRM